MTVRELLKPYLQPAFLVCVAVLAVAVISMDKIMKIIDPYTIKEAIYLKKPFTEIDESQLGPYKVIQRPKIENHDIIEELGTEEYLEWVLEDSEVDEHSPVRYCSLFLTYYTGNPNPSPHVPEQCYLGSGHVRELSEKIRLSFSPDGEQTRKIDIRYLVFNRSNMGIYQTASKISVMYLFRVNGFYAAGPKEVRAIMASNFFGRYSYFSKVEWNFFGLGYGNTQTRGNRDEVISASEKLLSIIIPLLEDNHWPDWKQGEDAEDTANKSATGTANATALE